MAENVSFAGKIRFSRASPFEKKEEDSLNKVGKR